MITPGTYQHFKGGRYDVIGTAIHSETGEELAVYRPLYGDRRLTVRPLAMFAEQIEHDGYSGPRFALVWTDARGGGGEMMAAMTQPMSVLTSHASQDWYTPPEIIEMVRLVLGTIGLDPASDRTPQEWIRAESYYSQKGLETKWNLRRTVFCNPPYGKPDAGSNQAAWSRKMATEYKAGHFEQGILLINSTHGYRWYEELWTRYPVCLARERIRFIKPDGTQGGQAKRGQTFVYFGTDPSRFIEVFSAIGRIVLP